MRKTKKLKKTCKIQKDLDFDIRIVREIPRIEILQNILNPEDSPLFDDFHKEKAMKKMKEICEIEKNNPEFIEQVRPMIDYFFDQNNGEFFLVTVVENFYNSDMGKSTFEKINDPFILLEIYEIYNKFEPFILENRLFARATPKSSIYEI